MRSWGLSFIFPYHQPINFEKIQIVLGAIGSILTTKPSDQRCYRPLPHYTQGSLYGSLSFCISHFASLWHGTLYPLINPNHMIINYTSIDPKQQQTIFPRRSCAIKKSLGDPFLRKKRKKRRETSRGTRARNQKQPENHDGTQSSS